MVERQDKPQRVEAPVLGKAHDQTGFSCWLICITIRPRLCLVAAARMPVIALLQWNCSILPQP